MRAHELIHIFAPGKVANLQSKENGEDSSRVEYHSGGLHSELLLAWLPVSIELRRFPLAVFQNLIHLSAVPPPDARRPC